MGEVYDLFSLGIQYDLGILVLIQSVILERSWEAGEERG